jgi:hypothetical protein
VDLDLAGSLLWLGRISRQAIYLHPFLTLSTTGLLLLGLVLLVMRRLEEKRVEANLGHVFDLVPSFRDADVFALPRRVFAISLDDTQLAIVRRRGLQSLLSVYSAEDIARVSVLINRERVPLMAISGFSLATTVNAVLRKAAETARSTWALRDTWRLYHLSIEIVLQDDVDPVHTLVFLSWRRGLVSSEAEAAAKAAVAEADLWCHRLQSIFQSDAP